MEIPGNRQARGVMAVLQSIQYKRCAGRSASIHGGYLTGGEYKGDSACLFTFAGHLIYLTH
jgi:hypothetical protein